MTNSTMLMVLAPALVALCVAGVYVGTQQEPLAGPEPPATTGTLYYVSTTGNNTNDGKSEATAWRTITYAAGRVVAGDTVMIKAGNYGPEQVVITNSGTETSPIVFEGYGGAPLLDGGNGLETGIQVNGNYVVLRNFEVNKYEIGIAVNGAEHVTLEGIDATYLGPRKGGFRGTGIGIWGCQHCVLRECNVTDAGAQNFTLAASSYILMEDCASYGVTTNDAVDYYIRLDRSDNCTIRNCLAQNKHPLSPVHAGHGITLKNQNRRNKVINCVARGFGEAIGVAHFSNDNEFINCTVYSDGGQARSGWCGAYFIRDGAERNKFINCKAFGMKDGFLLYDTDETPWKYRNVEEGESWRDGTPASVPPAVQQDNVFENCVIETIDFAITFVNPYGGSTCSINNTFKNCVFTGAKYMFYVNGAESGNAITNSIVTGISNKGYGASSKASFGYCNLWESFSISGTGNISMNPLFADPANGDYHLKSTGGRWDPVTELWVIDAVSSPCIDTGDPTDDYSAEPAINGGRINVGAYGNTAEASKSEIPAEVVGRYVFYNNSSFDGDDPAANAADDNAIATNKTALLPGGTATFANYTSYDKGINGVMVDISGLAGTPTSEDDFVFRIGNDNDPSGWIVLPPSLASITIRAGAGVGGSDRVTIIWADILKKQWVQVTVKATAVTGLTEDDVFYFGNAVGDSGNSATDATVNTTDEIRARHDLHKKTPLNPAGIDNDHDYNRDGVADTTDEVVSRQNNTTSLTDLNLITAP